MDASLLQLYRQYMQQVRTATLPSTRLLVQNDIQYQLYRYFFDPCRPNLPSSTQQIQLLKRLVHAIEAAIQDPNQESYAGERYEEHTKTLQELYGPLVTYLCDLQALPKASEAETAQVLSTISYFPPDPDPSTPPILIQESNNIIGYGPDVGLRTWESCLRLAYHLYLHPQKIRGKKVLELGAGTGLLSIFCAGIHLGAESVLSTDGLSHVVDRIRANLDLNLSEGYLTPDKAEREVEGRQHNITVAELDWRWSEAQLREVLGDLKDDASKFDVVLGADLAYAPDMLDSLVGLLDILERRFCSPDPLIIVSTPIRDPETVTAFEKLCLKSSLTIFDLNQDDIPVNMRLQTGFFHEILFPIRLMKISRSR